MIEGSRFLIMNISVKFKAKTEKVFSKCVRFYAEPIYIKNRKSILFVQCVFLKGHCQGLRELVRSNN